MRYIAICVTTLDNVKYSFCWLELFIFLERLAYWWTTAFTMFRVAFGVRFVSIVIEVFRQLCGNFYLASTCESQRRQIYVPISRAFLWPAFTASFGVLSRLLDSPRKSNYIRYIHTRRHPSVWIFKGLSWILFNHMAAHIHFWRSFRFVIRG